MSNKYRYRRGLEVDSWVKKTGTIAVEQGDMVMITSSGKHKAVAASGDADDLIGVAVSASPTTDRTATSVRVLEIGHGTVFEMTVASSTYKYGDPFVISAKQLLLKKTVDDLQSTATNVVAVCAEDLDTAGTTVLVRFLSGIFQKDIALS
jgi:hypothetical protein